MNCSQIAEPGTGKTFSLLTLIPYAEKTKTKIAIIDTDGKLKATPSFQAPIKRGIIEVFDIGARTSNSTLVLATRNVSSLPSNPTGYLKTAEVIDNLSAKSGEYCVRALDTITTLQEHLRQMVKSTSGKVQFEYPQWAVWKNNLHNLFTYFYSIGEGTGINIVNMHELYDKNEITGEVKLKPLMDGSFRDEVGIYVDEWYQNLVKDNGRDKPVTYEWRVRPTSKIVLRTNVFPPEQTNVPQDWKPVYEKLL